jgi:DNA-binding LytR/AlgR family response regulator
VTTNALWCRQARIRAEKPDLVLLDVQMPRMDGFAVIEAVGADHMPAVIFVTAHDRYAVRAFEISAVDYLRWFYVWTFVRCRKDKRIA